jgi:predicted RNA-binding protein
MRNDQPRNPGTPARPSSRLPLRALVFAALSVTLLTPALRAQDAADQSARRAQFAGMQRVNGEITAINGATLTLKDENGATFQIVTTDNTRVMKGRGNTVKLTDLKVGDGAMAMGNLDAPNKTLHAAVLIAVDAAQVKALRDNLGKTYINGKVTAIDLDNAKMTVERPDHVSQTIAFDDSTSFKRGRGGRMGGGMGMGEAPAAAADSGESITLADIKVGDNVSGQGSVKAGVFTPTQLNVFTPGQGRRRSADGATTGAAANPAPGPQ